MMKYISTLLFVLVTITLSAQMSYSTKNKKAIKLFEEARKIPNEEMDPSTHGPNFRGGLKKAEEAISKDENFWEAHLLAGEYAEYIFDYETAITHFKRAIEIKPDHLYGGGTYFYLANLQQAVGDYDAAVKNATIFVKYPNANVNLVDKAYKILADCEFAKNSIAHPVDFNPINIGPGINTKYPEYFPTITVDGKTILFTRRIPDSRVAGPEKEQEDFYVSQLSDKYIWMEAVPMPKNINTVNNEGAPTISADGRSLVFVACPNNIVDGGYGEGRTGRGSCDLFITQRLGKTWTDPENLPGYVNSGHWETQPSLSSDGRTLYFIRGLRGMEGRSDSDIYVAYKDDKGIWGKPYRLPDYINTPANEESVLIHPDGKTLYFASRGHVGMGGSDLYMCRLQSDGTWSQPENLGYPINTRYDENSLMVSPDGNIAFFASDREGGYGDLDIYYFQLPEHLKPTKTVYFEGIVYNKNDKSPIPGHFSLVDLETGEEVIVSDADKVSGEFMVSLPVNHAYALSVEYPGYTMFTQNFNMVVAENQEAVHMDVPMIPIKNTIDVTELKNVFFDLNKATLRKESFIELNKFVGFLKDNPELKVEIRGHTDTRGDDEDNMILSSNRAKSVYDYVISQGVDKERLSHKGFGESMPKISDAQIEAMSSDSEKEAAHQQNRRTEYKIVE